MRRTLLCVIVGILLVPTTVQAERTEEIDYVAAEGLTIHCDAHQHPMVPQGSPDQHPSALDWLLSGEPECASADASNTAREAMGEERRSHGFGGGAVVVEPWEEGGTATARTTDVAYGADASYIHLFTHTNDGQRVAIEGCGSQSLIIPMDLTQPWPPAPPIIVWAEVPLLGIMDDLHVCFASTGTLVLTIEEPSWR